MYELGVYSGYHTVPAQRSVEPEQTTLPIAEQRTAESAAGRDTASLSGRAQPTAAASAEQVLGKLYGMGLVESASLPLNPEQEKIERPAAELRVVLPEAEGAAEQSSVASEEWRPYQPPSAATQLPQLISADGSVKLSLYPASDGQGELTLELNGIPLPLNADGTLLAGLADGSFRLMTLDGALLMQLLDAGMASLTLLPDGAVNETLPHPANGHAPQEMPAQGEEVQTASGLQREQSADGEGLKAAELRFQTVHELFSDGGRRELQLPQEKPGGAAEWILERAAERSFRETGLQWLRQGGDPGSPESVRQLADMQRGWAAQTQREDPALFRAFAQTAEQSPKAEANRESVLPSRSELVSWAAGQRSVGETAAKEAQYTPATGGALLRSALSALRPGESGGELISLLRSGYVGAAEAAAARRGDEDGALTRRLSDYLSQLLSGRARQDMHEQAELLDLPQEPDREKDELERAWKRRQIAYEVESSWTENLRSWLKHVDGWQLSRCQTYVNERTNEWTTELMRHQPAQFRQWLTSPARYQASEDWVNSVTGSFPINTLPEGFTDEDLRSWLRWDVLDYL